MRRDAAAMQRVLNMLTQVKYFNFAARHAISGSIVRVRIIVLNSTADYAR